MKIEAIGPPVYLPINHWKPTPEGRKVALLKDVKAKKFLRLQSLSRDRTDALLLYWETRLRKTVRVNGIAILRANSTRLEHDILLACRVGKDNTGNPEERSSSKQYWDWLFPQGGYRASSKDLTRWKLGVRFEDDEGLKREAIRRYLKRHPKERREADGR